VFDVETADTQLEEKCLRAADFGHKKEFFSS